jgi:hypothetical protein
MRLEMHILKRFFSDWWNLLTLPSWYPFAVQSSGWSVFLFTVVVMLLLAFAKMPLLYMREFPVWRLRLEETLSSVSTHFPSDLFLHWNGSTLDINPKQKTMVPFPAWWGEAFPASRLQKPTHLAIIQPEASSSTQLNTWFLLSEQNVSVNNWAGAEDSVAWRELLVNVPPTTLNTDTFKKVAPTIVEYYDLAITNGWPFIGLALFFFMLMSFGVSVLWESIFFYVLFKLSGTRISYGRTLKLTTFLFLAAYTINGIATSLYPHLDPIWETLTLWAYFFVVVYSQRRVLSGNNDK